MTIHEAIATGKRFRRPGRPWLVGPISKCLCEITEHLGGTPVECSGFSVKCGEAGTDFWLPKKHYVAHYWEVEPSEEDFQSQAENILTGLGLRLLQPEKVPNE